jgi:hypothetical protein
MEQQTETTQDQESKRFGNTFEQFGERMAAWGEEFGRFMEAWGEEFGRRMEAWGEEFGQRMEVMGKEFGPRVETWSEDLARGVKKAGKRVGEWMEGETPAPAADTDSLRDERLAILRMVQEGKISVPEAEGLLRAMGE